MNTKLLYLPSDLPERPPEIRDAVDYVMHRTYVGRALWDTTDQHNNHTTFTRLHAARLASVQHNYRDGLDWLLGEAKALETDGHYIVGQKSRGYRWTGGYDHAVRRASTPRLSKRITDQSRQTFAQHTKAHRHLISWLKRATMLTAEAMAFTAKLVNENPETNLMSDAEYRQTVRMTIQLIHSGEWQTTVCDYGRFHSPYTALLSDLRQFVRFDGQRVFNVDIANSQPLVLSLLFPKSGRPEDMDQYTAECERGTFYDSLMARFNVPSEKRGQFKRDVFREIYYGQANQPTELRQEFIRLYPNVWQLMKTEKSGNYRQLAWAMQRAESRLMIDTVVARLAAEHPDTPLISIHDSVLSTAEHIDTIKLVMAEEFGKAGIHPTLKVTSYN